MRVRALSRVLVTAEGEGEGVGEGKGRAPRIGLTWTQPTKAGSGMASSTSLLNAMLQKEHKM